MSQSFPEAPVAAAPQDALVQIRTFWHYRPDYDYRPDLFEYAEFYTSDPDYVVLDVGMMATSGEHTAILNQLWNALHILAESRETPIHVSREANIAGIPGSMLISERTTHTLAPDLAVWGWAAPAKPYIAYRYNREGVPLLTLEVVSHSSAAMRANDLERKWHAYAHMGIREYWILDTQAESPFSGYTLDAPAGAAAPLPAYRRIEVNADTGGQVSRVLGTALSWAEDTLECWHAAWECWVSVEDIPIIEERIQAEARGEARGEARAALADRLDLLLRMRVPLDICLDLGLDLRCMDTVPGVWDLMQTQGDLAQLRRHIPPRPPGWDTAAERQYVTELLRASPAYPSPDYPGPG